MSLDNPLFKTVVENQFKDKFGEKEGADKLKAILDDDSLDDQAKIDKIHKALGAGKIIKRLPASVEDEDTIVQRSDGSGLVAIKKDAKNFDGRLFRMGGGRRRGKATKRRGRGRGRGRGKGTRRRGRSSRKRRS